MNDYQALSVFDKNQFEGLKLYSTDRITIGI